MVDNRTPRYDAYIHTRQRLKEMAERERNRIIQRDNRKLLENMRKIMLSGGDRVDNKNFYHKRKRFFPCIIIIIIVPIPLFQF